MLGDRVACVLQNNRVQTYDKQQQVWLLFKGLMGAGYTISESM